MKEFNLNKPYRKLRISSYVVLLLFYIISLKYTTPGMLLSSIYFISYLSIIIFLELKQYNNISLSVNDKSLILKWRGSFKKKKIDINNLKNINLSKNKLTLIENNNNYEYTISDFRNEQRKNLLNFFKMNFDNVTIN